MKTVLEVIQATTAYFQKNGVESPRLNIEHLLAHILGKKRMDLYLEFDRALGDSELEPLRELVKRRARREPLQHLLGSVEFCGKTFLTDKRALVPRPETEQLCELVEATVKTKTGSIRNILDVGTGSGVIAVILAATFAEAAVTAVDISRDALQLAIENATRHGVLNRITFREADLFTGLQGTFELIVANLPYVDRQDLDSLAPEVRCDPRLALDGGLAGMEILNRFVPMACEHLRGLLALEIGSEQGAAVSGLLAEHNYQDIRVQSDYQGRDRFVFATYG